MRYPTIGPIRNAALQTLVNMAFRTP